MQASATRGPLRDTADARGAADRVARALKVLTDDMAALSGQALFDATCLLLTRELGCDYAFVGMSVDDATVTTLALANLDTLLAPMTYELAGTPCEDAADHNFCLVAAGAAAKYPRDLLLDELGVEGYAGVRLSSRNNDTIGVLSVMSTSPIGIDEVTV